MPEFVPDISSRQQTDYTQQYYIKRKLFNKFSKATKALKANAVTCVLFTKQENDSAMYYYEVVLFWMKLTVNRVSKNLRGNISQHNKVPKQYNNT